MMKRYVVKEAPADFAGHDGYRRPDLDHDAGHGEAISSPPAAMSFIKTLMAGVTESEYLGQEKVGEVMCHHCRFIQEDFDWDIWIEVGKQPLVHKVQPDLTKQLAGAGAQIEDAKLSYTVTLSDWNVSPKFTRCRFHVHAARRCAEGRMTLLEMPEEPPHRIAGAAGAAVYNDGRGGHPIDLKKHLGKERGVARFLGHVVRAMRAGDAASGCSGQEVCRQGLRVLRRECRRGAATIKEFFTTSQVGGARRAGRETTRLRNPYQVEGIPQTLLIGKDGKVQVVHVGYSGQLGKLLTKEIEDLLAGKDLAGETLAKAEEGCARSSRRRAERDGKCRRRRDAPAGKRFEIKPRPLVAGPSRASSIPCAMARASGCSTPSTT